MAMLRAFFAGSKLICANYCTHDNPLKQTDMTSADTPSDCLG
jgi:hypothetical protein